MLSARVGGCKSDSNQGIRLGIHQPSSVGLGSTRPSRKNPPLQAFVVYLHGVLSPRIYDSDTDGIRLYWHGDSSSTEPTSMIASKLP